MINRSIDLKAVIGLPENWIKLYCLCEIFHTTKGRMGKFSKKSDTLFLPGEAVALDSQADPSKLPLSMELKEILK